MVIPILACRALRGPPTTTGGDNLWWGSREIAKRVPPSSTWTGPEAYHCKGKMSVGRRRALEKIKMCSDSSRQEPF